LTSESVETITPLNEDAGNSLFHLFNGLGVPTGFGNETSFISPTDYTATWTWYINQLYQQTQKYPLPLWKTGRFFNMYSTSAQTDPNFVWFDNENGMGASLSADIAYGHCYGANSTDLNNLVTFATSLLPFTDVASYNFTNDLYANCNAGTRGKFGASGPYYYSPVASNMISWYGWLPTGNTLGAAISATSGVGITFSSGTNIPSMSSIKIDNEVFGITVGTGGACAGASCTLSSGNVVRALYGTTAATHSNGAAVNN
jgi:hypothetical protein